MLTLNQRQIFKVSGAFFAASAMIAASPAAADTNTDNASETVATEAVVPAAEAEADASAGSESLNARYARPVNQSRGDVKFRNLFASWRSLDDADPNAAIEVQSVSIPSQMPLQGAVLTSDYGMRTHPVLKRRKRHRGVDLAAATGTPVFATADGVVGRSDSSRTYGLVVYLDHGADLQTRYAHMSKLAVAEGEYVNKGEIIGYVGSTGRSTGPHLHYEVRIDGVAVNPIPYMLETQAQQSFAQGTPLPGELSGRGGE